MENEIEREFGDVVEALRAAPCARVAPGFTRRVMDGIAAEPAWRRFVSPSTLFAAAATLVAMCAFASLFLGSGDGFTTATLVEVQRADGGFGDAAHAPYVQAFAVKVLASDPTAPSRSLSLAVAALVRGQAADGGWGSDELSLRNAAALAAAADAGDEAAACALRRAQRHLRARGLPSPRSLDLVRDAKTLYGRFLGTATPESIAPLAVCSKL